MRCGSHLSVAIVVYLSALTLSAQGPTDTLDIYWIDVEGGAATLIVTPAQESVLMDAGWARSDDRDVLRIQAAMRNANVDRIDYFIASHFHGDHVGGLPALSASVDIGQFIDHGDPVGQDDARGKMLWDGYLNVSAGKRRTVAPGDKLRLRGVELTIVTAHGRILDRPLLPLGPNPFCEGAQPGRDDQGENSRSVGYLLSLGPAPQGFLGHLIAREYSQEECRNGEARSRCGGGGGSPEGDRRCCRERPWGTVFGPAQARDGAASAARRGS